MRMRIIITEVDDMPESWGEAEGEVVGDCEHVVEKAFQTAKQLCAAALVACHYDIGMVGIEMEENPQ